MLLLAVPSSLLEYANGGPILTGLIPAGWWTERATFSYPNGSSLVDARITAGQIAQQNSRKMGFFALTIERVCGILTSL